MGPRRWTATFKARLNSFGHDGVVLGPVIGAFGEMSDNVKHSSADAIAAELANERCSYYSDKNPRRCDPTFATSCTDSGA